MTMPVNITADPLEALNAPVEVPVTEVDPNALPFPEEVTPDLPIEEAPATSESVPTVDWDADTNPYKAQVDELTATISQYKPLFEKYQEEEARKADEAVEVISKKVEQASEESSSPLTDTDKVQVRTAIKGYLEYQKALPQIQQERLIGSAINYAGLLVGDTATVRDLRSTAAGLLKKYGTNVQGMEAYVAARLEQNKEIAAEKQKAVAAQRVTSGVDNVATAPAQSGALRTMDDYEKAIYKGVTLTDKQWANYRALRAQRGLD